MTANANAPSSENMVFPAAIAPIGVFFVVVPAAIILAAIYVLVRYNLPWIIIASLPVVIVTCGMLIKQAVSDMSEVTVEWSSQGLTVRSALGGSIYSWTELEKIELHNPGASFGDRGRADDARASIGLFVRDPSRKEREHDAPPDVTILSRSGDDVAQLPKLVERLSAMKRGNGGGKDGPRKFGAPAPALGKAAKSGKAAGAKSFRRTANG
jgi:hypothetical protein